MLIKIPKTLLTKAAGMTIALSTLDFSYALPFWLDIFI